MVRKEFVRLLEDDILLFDKLAGRLHNESRQGVDIPRQQLTVLVRLSIGGHARLKDIARREGITTPNLCAAFRKLEPVAPSRITTPFAVSSSNCCLVIVFSFLCISKTLFQYYQLFYLPTDLQRERPITVSVHRTRSVLYSVLR